MYILSYSFLYALYSGVNMMENLILVTRESVWAADTSTVIGLPLFNLPGVLN